MSHLNHILCRAAAAATTLILAACDGEPSSPRLYDAAQGGAASHEFVKLKLQLNWVAEPEFGGFYAAQQRALYQAEGLEVELAQGGPDVPAAQLVATGKVDLAVVAGTQLLEVNDKIAEEGDRLVALYAVYQHNPMGVMVHASSPHQTLMQLWESESTLAIQEGLADYEWLNKRFPGGKRRIVPYNGNLAQFAADPALASQCFAPSEPVALGLQGVATRVFMMGESGFDPYNTVVVATRAFAEKNRDACARFVRATALGWRSYINEPHPFNETMARLNPAMTVEAMDRGADVQRKLVEDDETKRVGLGGMRYARWEEIVNQMAEIGRIARKPDPASVFIWDTEAGTAR